MKKLICSTALIISLCLTMQAETTPPSEDIRTFVLSPTAPPVPAMKYQLMYDDFADRLPGDAVILYLDAIYIMGPDAAPKASQALEAYKVHDMATFNNLAPDAVNRHTLFQELDLAARRENCDWQIPFREMGGMTLLPHLALLRDLGYQVSVRALWETEQGKTADALKDLRIGYEMSYKVSNERTLVSRLVGLRIAGMMNEATAALMNRPESPNFYWALVDLPSRKSAYHIGGERFASATATVPDLAKAKAGEELTAEQWSHALHKVQEFVALIDAAGQGRPDPITGTSPEIRNLAQKEYAELHHLNADQAAKVEPAVYIGSYYFHQYEIIFDESYKLHGLQYPVMMARAAEVDSQANDLYKAQPANPFLYLHSGIPSVRNFARVDRQIAALTAVEAIRSYAAGHNGELPAKLADITETPAPENPATAKAFEYRVENKTAILSDDGLDMPLKYTITIRK